MTSKIGIRVELYDTSGTLRAALLRDDVTFATAPRAGERVLPVELGLYLRDLLVEIKRVEQWPHVPGVRSNRSNADSGPQTWAVIEVSDPVGWQDEVLDAARNTGWRVQQFAPAAG